MSESQRVCEFTRVAFPIPKRPQPFSRGQLEFVTVKVLTELSEAWSVFDQDSYVQIRKCLEKAAKEQPNKEEPATTDIENVERVADAFVDIKYFLENGACKNGVNLSRIFDVVHQANMAKRWPDGTFHLDATGKVVKPPGWKEPDVEKEVQYQMENGSF